MSSIRDGGDGGNGSGRHRVVYWSFQPVLFLSPFPRIVSSKIQTHKWLKTKQTNKQNCKNGDFNEAVQPSFRFLFPMLWIICLNSKLLSCVLQVRWMWALFVVIAAPYFMTFIKCTWRACFKTTRTPTASPFLAVSIYILVFFSSSSGHRKYQFTKNECYSV